MITPLQAKRLDRLAERVKALPVTRRDLLMSELEAITYTPNEIATLCGVHPETVRRWIRGGQLAAVKLGGKEYRIAKVELARFWREKGGGELFARDGANDER